MWQAGAEAATTGRPATAETETLAWCRSTQSFGGNNAGLALNLSDLSPTAAKPIKSSDNKGLPPARAMPSPRQMVRDTPYEKRQTEIVGATTERSWEGCLANRAYLWTRARRRVSFTEAHTKRGEQSDRLGNTTAGPT